MSFKVNPLKGKMGSAKQRSLRAKQKSLRAMGMPKFEASQMAAAQTSIVYGSGLIRKSAEQAAKHEVVEVQFALAELERTIKVMEKSTRLVAARPEASATLVSYEELRMRLRNAINDSAAKIKQIQQALEDSLPLTHKVQRYQTKVEVLMEIADPARTFEIPETSIEKIKRVYNIAVVKSRPVQRPVSLPLKDPVSARVVLNTASRVMLTHADVIKALANR